jgi:hypothetical protein
MKALETLRDVCMHRPSLDAEDRILALTAIAEDR